MADMNTQLGNGLRRQQTRFQRSAGSIQRRLLLAEGQRTVFTDASQIQTEGRQALIRIVGPQRKPKFCPGREHAVGLAHTSRRKIVNHDADITGGARKNGLAITHRAARRIQAGDKALCCSFFISGRSIDLAGEIQPLNLPHLQGGTQTAGIEKVILNRISRLHDHRRL